MATTAAKVTTTRETADIAAFRKLLVEARGGEHVHVALLGLQSSGSLRLIERVERGFSFSTFERFRRNIGLSVNELAELVQIKPRTLIRRRAEGRLTPEESDRLLRASRILGSTLELFEGDAEAARVWLATPLPALGDAPPLEIARTDIGAREVEKLIGRLEHGIFS